MRHKEYPEDKLGFLYLCREYYLHLQIPQALAAFDELLKLRTDDDRFFSEVVIGYCYFTIGQCYRYLMHKNDNLEVKDACLIKASNSFEMGIKENPKYIGNYIGQSYIYNEIGNYKLALFIIKKALKSCVRYFHWLESGSLWTYELFNNLAVANNKIGNKVEALGFATLAYKLAPNEEMIKNNYYVCLNDKISIKDLL